MKTDKIEVLNFNWEDSNKIPYNIGMLAQDGEDFYIALKPLSRVRRAYANGYRGVPGFKPEIYKSGTMFDFFIRRLEDQKTLDPMEDLKRSGAKSMIDSFYLQDNIDESHKELCVEQIKAAYEIQQKKQRAKSKRMLAVSGKSK